MVTLCFCFTWSIKAEKERFRLEEERRLKRDLQLAEERRRLQDRGQLELERLRQEEEERAAELQRRKQKEKIDARLALKCPFWPLYTFCFPLLSCLRDFWTLSATQKIIHDMKSSLRCYGVLHPCRCVLSFGGSSRLWRLSWRSDSLRERWSSLLFASVLLLSGTLTLKPALTTVSSTTTPKVKTAQWHNLIKDKNTINSSLLSLPQPLLKHCIQRCWVLACSEGGG